MSRHAHTQLCGAECRYRGLYEGTQTSLTDMASKQAAALGRVGRLRSGMITTLKRNFGRQFSEAERHLGRRLSDLDDEILLAYLGSFLQLAALTPEDPEGLEPLRGALLAAGYTLPAGADLSTWAECVRAQTHAAPVENLDDLFAEEETPTRQESPPQDRAPQGGSPRPGTTSSGSQRRRLTPPENPALPPAKREEPAPSVPAAPAKEEPSRSSRRKGKKRRAGEQPAIQPNTDDLAELFGPEPGEPGWVGVPDTYDDIPLPEEPDEDPYEPPYDPYADEPYSGAEEDEFTRLYAEEEPGADVPDDGEGPAAAAEPAPAEEPEQADQGDSSGEEEPEDETSRAQDAPDDVEASAPQAEATERRSLRPRPPASTPKAPEAEQDDTDDLSALFGDGAEESETAPEAEERRDVLVAPTRTRRRAEQTLQLPGTETAAEAPKRRPTKAAAKAAAEQAAEERAAEKAAAEKVQDATAASEEGASSAAATEASTATHVTASDESVPAKSGSGSTPAPARMSTTMGLPLRPEVFLPSPAPKTRSRRGAPAKVVRASALPPDAQIFDVPPETQSEAVPGELTDEIRTKLLSSVCIPRPVFYQDLLAVAGSSDVLAAWESENRESNDSPVRFIPPKARHRARGSLVLPYDYHRTAATEFSRSIWAECMKRYRGAKLYELGVLIHRLDAEIVGHRLGEHTVLLRLNQPRGLVGVSVVIDTTLGEDEATRNALVADVSELLSERLTLVAVLVTNAELLETTIQALTDEAGRRRWDPSMPVIAAKSWEYAEDKGSSSFLVIGG